MDCLTRWKGDETAEWSTIEKNFSERRKNYSAEDGRRNFIINKIFYLLLTKPYLVHPNTRDLTFSFHFDGGERDGAEKKRKNPD